MVLAPVSGPHRRPLGTRYRRLVIRLPYTVTIPRVACDDEVEAVRAEIEGHKDLVRLHPVGAELARPELGLLHESRAPDLEELVQIRARDTQATQPLEQWVARILGLFEPSTR